MQRAEQEGEDRKGCRIVAERIGKQKKARRAVKSGGDRQDSRGTGSNLDRMNELPHEYRFCHMKAYPKCDYHGEYELLTGTHSTSMPGLNEILELAWIIIFGMIS